MRVREKRVGRKKAGVEVVFRFLGGKIRISKIWKVG